MYGILPKFGIKSLQNVCICMSKCGCINISKCECIYISKCVCTCVSSFNTHDRQTDIHTYLFWFRHVPHPRCFTMHLRQTDRETDRQIDIQTDRQPRIPNLFWFQHIPHLMCFTVHDREAERQIDRQTGRQTPDLPARPSSKNVSLYIYHKETDRQTDRPDLFWFRHVPHPKCWGQFAPV